MDTDESLVLNGSGQDNEMKNFKKRTKNCFLMFCEVVLKHEGIISEPLNSSQESINEHHAQDGIKFENSTFNSDSDSTQNEMVANYDAVADDGGGGDSFNSVTCFCGKPFAGRPMIECSGCLTWLHMSCAKVKRKNIPEFYYCDSCKKTKGVITAKTTTAGTASSDETSKPLTGATKSIASNGTTSSNNGTVDGLFLPSAPASKPRKLKLSKKNSSSSESDSAKIHKKTNANGKLRKIRQKLSPATKKIRQTLAATSPSAMRTKASPNSSSLSLSDFNSPSSLSQSTETINGIIKENSINNLSTSSLLKSSLATNNNNIYNNLHDGQNSSSLMNGDSPEKYGGKKLKL